MGARNATKFTEGGQSSAVGELQLRYKHTICLLVDEVSMIGRCFMGQLAKACSHVFGNGEVADTEKGLSWGGLNIVLFFGDFCQLGPVLDPGGVLYSGTEPKNPVARYGELAYASLASVYALTEPVRQDKESDFYKSLHDVRMGRLTAESATFWNRRQQLHLPDAEKDSFNVQAEGLLVLTCRRVDRAAVNAEYIRSLHGCCRVNSDVVGKHAKDDGGREIGMCKSIPVSIVYAVGMVVKLTVNLCPEWGLCNGSRGTIVDIIYPGDDGYIPPTAAASSDQSTPNAETVFPIVIVDFPDYCGSAVLLDEHKTYVPIVAMERRCAAKSKCCYRRGLPLVCLVFCASAVHVVVVSVSFWTFAGDWQG